MLKQQNSCNLTISDVNNDLPNINCYYNASQKKKKTAIIMLLGIHTNTPFPGD